MFNICWIVSLKTYMVRFIFYFSYFMMGDHDNRLISWFKDKRDKSEPRSSWVALFAVFLTFIVMTIPENTFGIIYGDLVDKYDCSRADIGWAISVQWTFVFMSSKCTHKILSHVTIYIYIRFYPSDFISNVSQYGQNFYDHIHA